MYDSNYYDKQEKTSYFKDSLGQIRRLDYGWVRATRWREQGDLEQWRWVLDTQELELTPDIERLKESGKDYTKQIQDVKDKISKNMKDKNKAEVYKALMEFEKLLRMIQEVAGKGTKLVDVEEGFI